MIETASPVARVKRTVESCVGQKVKFKIKKGKSKSIVSEGVIARTYPSIFTVRVENKGFKRMVSFNYIDILTNHVEFFRCNDGETKIV
ncbi:MAG: Veg family protein [Sedimentibacter sp.]|uniref:Veg family protein n=1 Tax=Sedimentibacter sp. TaxID=1960295 RepID=UPI003158B837